jgi:hypothetical protein
MGHMNLAQILHTHRDNALQCYTLGKLLLEPL